MEPVLSVSGLGKAFGPTVAVCDLDLELYPGQSLALLGPNGAGKTTTLKMLATLLKPDTGSIKVMGKSSQDPYAVRPLIGFMPDVLGIYPEMLVSEYLEFFARAYPIPKDQIPARMQAVSRFAGLQALLDQPLSGMSRGMLQRVALARALLHDPPLLLLDEPAAGLDPRSRVEFRRLLQELIQQGKSAVISSHVLSDLEDTCTHIAVIERGQKICLETMDEFMKRGRGPRMMRLEVSSDLDRATTALVHLGHTPREEDGALWFVLPRLPGVSSDVLRRLLEQKVEVESFAEATLSLEDAYLARSQPDNP